MIKLLFRQLADNCAATILMKRKVFSRKFKSSKQENIFPFAFIYVVSKISEEWHSLQSLSSAKVNNYGNITEIKNAVPAGCAETVAFWFA
jgi:hypothetical protein